MYRYKNGQHVQRYKIYNNIDSLLNMGIPVTNLINSVDIYK